MENSEQISVQLLTVKAAAARLSISAVTVRRYIAAGQLGSVKLGARVLVPVSELEAFVARRLRPASTESE